MAIWISEINELERLYKFFKGKLPDLEKEMERLIKAGDENMILLYSRRSLEVIVTDLCEFELKRPRKTEPLKGIIDKLHKEEKVPSNIITSMDHLNSLSAYGAHPKDFDPEQVKPVLNNLSTIIRWYLKYKQIVTIDKTEVDEEMIRLRKEPLEGVTIKERNKVQEKPLKAGKHKLISIIAFSPILVIAAILIYPKIIKKDKLDELKSSGGRISVAVMPFQNMTNDTIWNVWQDGIQFNLITSLSNYSDELKVSQTESVENLLKNKGLINYSSITPSVASTISQKLDANIFIYGNINQAGNTIRVNAQVIDSKTEESFKSFQLEGKAENILPIIDSLSVLIKNFLIISELKKDLPDYIGHNVSTGSPEALRYFIYGRNEFSKGDFLSALEWLYKAVSIDSNFFDAITLISIANGNEGKYDEAKKWALKAYKKRDQMPVLQQIKTNRVYAEYFETPREVIKYLRQQLDYDDQSPTVLSNLGNEYGQLYQYDKAIPELEKALEIYEKWGTKPYWAFNYANLAGSYHKTGMYKKAKKLFKKAEQDFPNDPSLFIYHAILSLTEGDTVTANDYIRKLIVFFKENSYPETEITTIMAYIYSDAGILDKAEEYYRQALSFDTGNPVRFNFLAYFLIDKDRNVQEGLELVERALKSEPDNYSYLDTKGWGLYKQGKNKEALKLLEKCDSLKPVYDHELFLHLEAARKAVAGQKNMGYSPIKQ